MESWPKSVYSNLSEQDCWLEHLSSKIIGGQNYRWIRKWVRDTEKQNSRRVDKWSRDRSQCIRIYLNRIDGPNTRARKWWEVRTIAESRNRFEIRRSKTHGALINGAVTELGILEVIWTGSLARTPELEHNQRSELSLKIAGMPSASPVFLTHTIVIPNLDLNSINENERNFAVLAVRGFESWRRHMPCYCFNFVRLNVINKKGNLNPM